MTFRVQHFLDFSRSSTEKLSFEFSLLKNVMYGSYKAFLVSPYTTTTRLFPSVH